MTLVQELCLKTRISNIRLSRSHEFVLLTGYDGRVSLQLIDHNRYSIMSLKNYISFKAHEIANDKRLQNLYQINDCGFVQNHYQAESFFTCASNGDLTFWEISKREKVKNIPAGGKTRRVILSFDQLGLTESQTRLDDCVHRLRLDGRCSWSQQYKLHSPSLRVCDGQVLFQIL